MAIKNDHSIGDVAREPKLLAVGGILGAGKLLRMKVVFDRRPVCAVLPESKRREIRKLVPIRGL